MPKTLSEKKPAVKRRVKKVVKALMESTSKNNGKKLPLRKALVNAGYSQNYADSGQIKKTRTWNEYMAERLSDDKLTQVHGELLESAEIQHYIFPSSKGKAKLKESEIKAVVESVGGCRLIYIKDDHYLGQVAYYQAPDNRSRKDALDMAYKLKGNYAPDRIEMSKRKYQDLSSAELMALQTKLKNYLTKR